MDRRTLLRTTVAGAGGLALPFTAWSAAYAAPAQNATGPYGALQAADANGIRLPAGFTSRVIARSRQPTSAGDYEALLAAADEARRLADAQQAEIDRIGALLSPA